MSVVEYISRQYPWRRWSEIYPYEFRWRHIDKMKNIIKIIVIDGIIFLVSGLITAFIGKFTADSYGTILILCGLVPMVSGIVSHAGPRHRPAFHICCYNSPTSHYGRWDFFN